MIFKKKVKAMPSSLREKKRYIVFKVNEVIERKSLEFLLNKQLLSFTGIKGFAEMNPKLIDFNERNGKGILRANLSRLNDAISSLLMLKTIEGKAFQVQILSVSGTLRKPKKALIKP